MSGNVSRSAKGPEGKTVLTTFEPNRDGGLSGSGFHMVPRYPLILFWKLHGMPSVLDTSASSLHFVIDYFHSCGILDNKPTILGWFLQPCMVLMIHENMALPQAPSHRWARRCRCTWCTLSLTLRCRSCWTCRSATAAGCRQRWRLDRAPFSGAGGSQVERHFLIFWSLCFFFKKIDLNSL